MVNTISSGPARHAATAIEAGRPAWFAGRAIPDRTGALRRRKPQRQRSSRFARKTKKAGSLRTQSEFIAGDTDEDSPFWGRPIPHFGNAANPGDAPNSLPFQRVRGCRSCQENSIPSARLSISPVSRKSFCVAIRHIDRNMRWSCAAPKAIEPVVRPRRPSSSRARYHGPLGIDVLARPKTYATMTS